MNNKHKLKRIKWGTLITITCLIGIILLNVNAKSLNSSKTKVKKLENGTTACKKKDFNTTINIERDEKKENTAIINVSIQNVKDGDKFHMYYKSVKNNSNSTIDDNDPKYKLINIGALRKVTVSDDEYNNAEEAERVINNLYHGKFTIDYFTDDLTNIYVVIVYGRERSDKKEYGKSTAEAAKILANDYIANFGKYTLKPNEPDEEPEDTVECYYTAQGVAAFEDSTGEILNYSFERSKSDADKISQLNTDIAKLDEISISGDYDTITAAGKKVITDTKNGIGTLTCSKDDVYKEGEGKNSSYLYTNKNEYYHEESKKSSDGTCETTCKEAITVEYGPPVATKAGMCFEYRVKVQSKVACKSTWNGGGEPDEPKLCQVYPKCSNHRIRWDQGGPDEEFDSCINKCDGGKYSQKCINKCYKEVYENINNKKISYDSVGSNVTSKLLANADDIAKGLEVTTNDSLCDNNNNPSGDTYAKLVTAMRYNDECKYEYENKKIVWSCSSNDDRANTKKYWKELGRYYFATDAIAKKTVQSISSSCNGEPGTNYKYFIDGDGFKRACYKKDNNGECASACPERCEWRTNDGTPGEDCYLNESDRNGKYIEELDKYYKDKSACLAQTSCSTKRAVFTINVKDESSTVDTGTTDFSAGIQNKNGVKQVVNILNNISPILDRSGCYGNSDKTNYYMTEWSFPGSWVNNKNGTVVHKEPSNTSGWQKKTNKFCISNGSSVNSQWYNWAENIKLDNETNYKTAKYPGTEEIIYNIKASTTDFGYFAWDANIQCFYATPSKGCPDGECENTGPGAHDTRSVDDNDLFPDESRTIENSSGNTEKIIGFNWTADARENLYSDINYTTDQDKSTTYEIDPPALISNIENGDTYSSANLEYEFTLNRKKLNLLKKMTIGAFKGDFIEHKVGKKATKKGKISKEYTIVQYQTDLLVESRSGIGGTRKRNIFCNNWDNGSCVKYS